MAITTRGGSKVTAEPNVTPMIDVMLVLLIIFMLVIPTITAGFQAVPPSGQNLKPHPEEDTDQVLGIDASGQYYLNKQPIEKSSLGARIKAIYESRTEDRLLYIKAHRELPYEQVLDAVDIAAKNGVSVAGMITEQVPGTISLIPSDNMGIGFPVGGKK